MITKKLTEKIKELRDLAPTKEVGDLMDHFERYLNLCEQKERGELAAKCKEECHQLASKALVSLGLSEEALFTYFEDERNFSDKEQKEIDQIKSELQSSSKKKNKIKIPKMRI